MSNIDFSEILDAAASGALESVTNATLQAVGQGLEDMANGLIAGLTKMKIEVKKDYSNTLQKMFQRIGENAQRSMLASYGQLVTRQEGPASRTHYRAGQGRLAGGILRNALGRPDFFEASAQGLSWGNIAMLDAAAAQWHRIAFGAGGRGGGEHAEYRITYGALAGTAIGFTEDDGPSPGFSMPSGVWIGPDGERVAAGRNARGADAFYPSRAGNSKHVLNKDGTITVHPNLSAKQNGIAIKGRPTGLRPTAGIEGKAFMDAGLRRIAEDLPKAIEAFIEDTFDGWINAAKSGFAPSADVIIQSRKPNILVDLEIFPQ